MFETDPQQVQAALRLLKITGRPDKPTVIRAFRDAAKEVHPDKFRTEAEKAAAHPKFLKLVAARDLCLQALQEQVDGGARVPPRPDRATSSAPPRPDRATSSAPPRPDRATSSAPPRPDRAAPRPTDYRAEWDAFVKSENAYFNAMTAVGSSLHVGLQAVRVTLFACLIAGGMAVLFVIIAALVAGAIFVAASATVAIPVAGWVVGGFALLGLLHTVGELWNRASASYARAADSIFRGVAVTGRAAVTFHATFCAVIAVLWAVGAVFLSLHGDAGLLGVVCVVMGFAVLLSYVIIFQLIAERMAELDAAFRRLREAPSFALVLAPRPQQRR